jgi:CDGSH-type Zn-finger protein
MVRALQFRSIREPLQWWNLGAVGTVGAPMKEPTIITQHREQLAYLLTEASEIEHGILCCYLFAAFSLKRGARDGLAEDEAGAVARWRGALMSIAVDEMLHLSIVTNLLAAIGFAPQFQRANFPVPPGYHPSGVVLALAPFDLTTLDHFLFLERPEGVDIADGAGFEAPPYVERATRSDAQCPSSEDYATVGHLYRGIHDGFSHLSEKLGEAALFVGAPEAQVGRDLAGLSGLIPVVDLRSAHRAIDTIVEQGEGTTTNSERSHYRRFVAIRDEYLAFSKDRPDFSPAHPVARNPVMRKPPTPAGKVHVSDPRAARVMDLGNAMYGLMLRLLARAFGQNQDPPAARRVLIGCAVDLMNALSPVAETLCRMPAGDASGVRAGLSFTMARSNLGAQPCTVWPYFVERTRDLAAALSKASEELDAGLATTAGQLVGLAARLEQGSPLGTPLRNPAVSAPPERDTSSGASVRAELSSLCAHARRLENDVFVAHLPARVDEQERLARAARRLRDSVIRPLEAAVERTSIGADATEGPASPLDEAPFAARLWRMAKDATRLRARVSWLTEIQEAAAALQDLACNFAPEECEPEPIARVAELTAMQKELPAGIQLETNGPYLLTNIVKLVDWHGGSIPCRPQMALCRCGGSRMKPFCDGTHARINFVDAKDPKRVPDRRYAYSTKGLSVLDNRGTCAHSGFCTDRLPSVFRVATEPFVDPDGAGASDIMLAAKACPSGALSYAVDGREAPDEQRPPKIEVSKDGPYRVTGGVRLIDERGQLPPRNEGASLERYSLCRCGQSQNKPFCSGMHWYVKFRDPEA